MKVNPDKVLDTLQYGFSQAVIVPPGRRILLSGQVSVDKDGKTVGAGDLKLQTEGALHNIDVLLSETGAEFSDVVFLRVYIAESEKNNQNVISAALHKYFPSDPPATSWLLVAGLSEPDWLIEIEAEAVIPDAASEI